MKKAVGMMIVGLIAAVAVLVGPASPVHAVTLNNWNVIELNATGDYVTVDVTATTLTVQWHAGVGNVLTAIGIDMFGCNIPGTPSCELTGVSGNDVTWSFHFDGGEYDGFGNFDSLKNSGPAETGGISSPLVFTYTDNNPFGVSLPTQFVAHVRYGNNCSGFVSNRTTTSLESKPQCGGAQVPEPGTLLTLGSGLIIVGVLIRGFRRMV